MLSSFYFNFQNKPAVLPYLKDFLGILSILLYSKDSRIFSHFVHFSKYFADKCKFLHIFDINKYLYIYSLM